MPLPCRLAELERQVADRDWRIETTAIYLRAEMKLKEQALAGDAGQSDLREPAHQRPMP